MKLFKILMLSFLVFGIFKSSQAQDVSSFYKVANTDASYDFNNGYQLLKNGAESQIQFKATENLPIALNVILTAQGNDAGSTIFAITFGNQQTLQLNIPFSKESHLENVYVNNKRKESSFYTNSYQNYNDKATVRFNIIIGNDFVEFIHINYLGEIERMQRYTIDNPSINIISTNTGKSFANIELQTEILPQLSAFAKNGLKIRKEANLNSERLNSIPYGEQVYILEDLENKDLEIYELDNTKGNLKVGGLSSKMIRVLFNNTVGYAYGGYLVPLLDYLGKENNYHTVEIENWDLKYYQGEEVRLNNQLATKKVVIDFNSYDFEKMDNSQRPLIASTLFPKLLTKEKIGDLVEHNKTQLVTLKNGQYTEYCEVTTADYQIAKIVYTKIKTDLTAQLKSEKTHYVTATKLNLRASSNLKSKILTSIPFGKSVEILDNNSKFTTIQGIRGKMVKVKYDNQQGYVFDAYLSPTQPFTTSSKKISDVTRFEKVMGFRKSKWKHNIGFAYEVNWHISPEFSPWAIIPSRDKFQALKTIRDICPTLNDVEFSWNENKQAYDVRSSNPKVQITVTDNSWVISYPDATMNEAGAKIVIVINTIAENLQKVLVSYEEFGC